MGGRAGEATVFPAEGPAGFDPAHPYADPAASLAQREHIVREKLVKVETAKVRRRCVQRSRRCRCVQRSRRCRSAPRASARTRVSWVRTLRAAPGLTRTRFWPGRRSCASAFSSATARRA
jgi:NADH dehydrogenase (ubiquinone) 1 beta subcomplex subunit 10